MKLTPVRIDIAKNVMQMHYLDEGTGEVVNKPINSAQSSSISRIAHRT